MSPSLPEEHKQPASKEKDCHVSGALRACGTVPLLFFHNKTLCDSHSPLAKIFIMEVK